MPVVVVFTKCDALLARGFGKLKQEEKELPVAEQLMKIKEYAREMLRNNTAQERLNARKHPPKDYVEMESKYNNCICCSLVQVPLHRYGQI